MQRHIILASTSPRRKELLEKAGVVFDVVTGTFEEDMTLPLAPHALAKFLSQGKAQSVAKEYPQSIIIAGDTFVVFGDKVIGKPHTPLRAKEMLQQLSGTAHSIVTGFTVLDAQTQKVISEAAETNIYFKNLSVEDIDAYIETGEPLDKAGAYAIQGKGGVFVDHIEGDFSTCVGLPIDLVLEALATLGVEFPHGQ